MMIFFRSWHGSKKIGSKWLLSWSRLLSLSFSSVMPSLVFGRYVFLWDMLGYRGVQHVWILFFLCVVVTGSALVSIGTCCVEWSVYLRERLYDLFCSWKLGVIHFEKMAFMQMHLQMQILMTRCHFWWSVALLKSRCSSWRSVALLEDKMLFLKISCPS